MRKYTSIILALAFILISITGLQMSIRGGGKPVATNVESNMAVSEIRITHQAPFYPKKAHEIAGYIFIIAGVTHLVLNVKPMLSYIKKK